MTYGAPSLFMSAVFVVLLPLVYFKFARPRFRRWPSRIAVLLGVWLLAFVIAYGDVLLIAREAKQLCETEAGLRVYRTVEAEGFAGVPDIDFWSTKGFRFLEFERPHGNLVRLVAGQDGEKIISKKEMLSNFEYKFFEEPTNAKVAHLRQIVRVIETGEILGEVSQFRLAVGWLDERIAGASGAHAVMCEGPKAVRTNQLKFNARRLIDSVFIPIAEPKN